MFSFVKYLFLLRKSIVPLSILTLSSLISASMILFLPAMQKLLFDKLFVTMDVWLLLKFSIFSLFLLLAEFFLHTVYTLYATEVQCRLTNSIKATLMKKLFQSKYQFITTKGSGFFIKRIVEDAPLISRGILHGIHGVNSLLLIAAVGLIVHFMNPWLVQMYITLLIVSLVCTLVLTLPSVILNGKVGQGYSDLSDLCYGIFPGIAEIKTNNLIPVIIGKMQHIHELMKKRFMLYAVFCSLQWQVASIVPRVGYALLLIKGLASVEAGEITIGTFYGLIAMLWVMFDPLDKLFFHYSFFHGAIMAVNRADAILKAPQEKSGSLSCEKFSSAIEVSNIHYGYDNQQVLHGLSLKITAGSDIAIVGETGCGKSTLVQLLLRIYDGYEGSIELDQKPLDTWELKSLRNRMLYIPATVPLFPLSIAENIDLTGEKSEQELATIVEKVQLKGLVSSLAEGVQTTYREEVGDFSGGEKQRIALGRCFTTKADILILDESTSALDEENEAAILTEIKKEFEEKTIIRISHKLSAIKGCDHVFVLKEGRIVEEGTLEELEEKNGEFCRLFNRAG